MIGVIAVVTPCVSCCTGALESAAPRLLPVCVTPVPRPLTIAPTGLVTTASGASAPVFRLVTALPALDTALPIFCTTPPTLAIVVPTPFALLPERADAVGHAVPERRDCAAQVFDHAAETFRRAVGEADDLRDAQTRADARDGFAGCGDEISGFVDDVRERGVDSAAVADVDVAAVVAGVIAATGVHDGTAAVADVHDRARADQTPVPPVLMTPVLVSVPPLVPGRPTSPSNRCRRPYRHRACADGGMAVVGAAFGRCGGG